MANVTEIFRHPLKAHGFESLLQVNLEAGKTMPWDRQWAVVHEESNADGSEWVKCGNFSRGAKAPGLMAIRAEVDENTEQLTLCHFDQPDITFDPMGDVSGFLEWVRPLMPENRAQSAGIISVPGRGLTDSKFPSISLNSHASRQDVSKKIGQDMSMYRWRGNIWIDGEHPWQELEWVGKQIQIGDVVLEGVEPIERCMATTANPETGQRDAETLKVLNEQFGHQNFGLMTRVLKGGQINVGDQIAIIS